MALRSLATATCQTIGVLRAARCFGQLPMATRLNFACYNVLQSNSFHCNPSTLMSNSDVLDTKEILKTVEKQEVAPIIDGVDLPGFTDSGFTIPTLETHAALVDGIRYDELPIVFIHSSRNNTIITVTDHKGKESLGRSSCGQEGFKNIKKSTNVAAQATGLSVGTKMLKKGIVYARVEVKGVGSGRLPSIKGLQMSGMKIVSITDDTHVPRDGPRPRKARRI